MADVPSYPTAAQVQQYLASYANHFDLAPRLRLNTCVKHVAFDEQGGKWALSIEGQGEEYFDKTVIAIGGMVGKPNLPVVEGIEKFGAKSVHSRAFKRPRDYEGKRVMVVGFGNSAADTATQLVGIADKVYIAHRHGARIVRLYIFHGHYGTTTLYSFWLITYSIAPPKLQRRPHRPCAQHAPLHLAERYPCLLASLWRPDV